MDNFFLNALFTAGCSNAMGIPRRAFSQSSCFWTHQREAKFSSTGVCWSPSKYQATRMPLNDCHAAVIKRGKRNLMCCKEDAVKGLQRWSMQTRDTLEMVSCLVPGLGPKWRRGCRRTRWTQKKKQCITLSAVTLMIFKHHTEICERGAQDRQKTQALTIRVRLSCLKTGREFASLRCNWKNGGMVELLWYYVCSESF